MVYVALNDGQKEMIVALVCPYCDAERAVVDGVVQPVSKGVAGGLF